MSTGGQQTAHRTQQHTGRITHFEPNQIGPVIFVFTRLGAELLVIAGAVSATSLVISGSIAVVGDAVYWLERRSRCLMK